MLSGNGRHRRPRQAPALVVAAGVTGSAIAIPLLGATGANAADGTTWDRVAECETGGAWSQNDGNGYYGGLQLSQKQWEQYGGLAYASSADQASRAQQIRVAEKVLAAEGVATWPTCGLLSGLNTGSSGSTASDTESDSSSSSSDGSASSDGTDSEGDAKATESDDAATDSDEDAGASASPSASASSDASDESDESSKSGKSSDSDEPTDAATGSATTKRDDADSLEEAGGISNLTETPAPGSGRHRGGSADGEAADGRSGSSSGRHASRGDDEARVAADGTYTVRTGDSLCAIADSLELDGGWRSLYAENKDVVGLDPDLILPGQKLALTAEPVEPVESER
ncbi:transglycosylase family protein [Streptomyces sp. CRN 30]|uniref:transglycosylase family protein n=1 Tax=Streptomyces sp. CRN 30 TaxID=3075613 RepID=UPI002A8028CD|nr:transglycosylase family protein [Streptomyces sp. CRN 30]